MARKRVLGRWDMRLAERRSVLMVMIYGHMWGAIYAPGVAWHCISRRLGFVYDIVNVVTMEDEEGRFRYPLPPYGWLITMNED